MGKTALHVVRTQASPIIEMHTEPREYLTEAEVEVLIKAAKTLRDRCMILMAHRHGLRVSELIGLRWADVRLAEHRVLVRRAKGSVGGEHPLSGREIRWLKRLRAAVPAGLFVFVNGATGAPLTRDGFAKIVRKAGATAGLGASVHPHQLRHACGYALVNRGTDMLTIAAYLGHKNVQNTQRYSAVDVRRFEKLWQC